MGLKVYVLTTSGVSEIIRIETQDNRLKSVICEHARYSPLPISPDYHFFVSSPTGIIQTYFGEHSFRTEVSTPINQGLSWELGLFVAHWVSWANNTESSIGEIQHVFISGRLSPSLTIHAVDAIEEKIEGLDQWLKTHDIQHESSLIVFPKDNEIQIVVESKIPVLWASDTKILQQHLGLPKLEHQTFENSKSPSRSRKKAINRIMFAVISLVVMLAAIYTNISPKWEKLSELESSGKFRQLVTELRGMRNGRSLLDLNIAAFFEEVQRERAKSLQKNTPLTFVNDEINPNCVFTERDITNRSDLNLISGCTGTIYLKNLSDHILVAWVSQSNQTEPLLTLLKPSTELALNNINHDVRLAVVVAKRPISSIYDWLTLIRDDPQNTDTQYLLEKSGISFRTFD